MASPEWPPMPVHVELGPVMTDRQKAMQTRWWEQAACRGHDPAMFFPHRGREAVVAVSAAKKVCASCPVLDECREQHINEKYGVWAGMSERERRQFRARRRLERMGQAS